MTDQITIKLRYEKENELFSRLYDWQKHAEGKVDFETLL